MLKLVICIILTMVISYLLGSCNSAIITVKLLKHEDIREHGSKNAGLTNTLRCYGKIPALFTLIGDLGKGIIAVLLSLLTFKLIMGGECFANASLPAVIDEKTVGYLSGIFSIQGRQGYTCILLHTYRYRPTYICNYHTVFRAGTLYHAVCFRCVHLCGGILPHTYLYPALLCGGTDNGSLYRPRYTGSLHKRAAYLYAQGEYQAPA